MTTSFTEISLGELPRWNPWPARLLALVPWQMPTRDLRKIETEYNQDKYAKLLALYREAPHGLPIQELRCHQFGRKGTDPICVSVGDRLFRTTVDEALQKEDDVFLESIADQVKGAASFVDLGCGYGRNLALVRQKFPDLVCHGGDYAANAVELARRLGLSVDPFNLNDEHYALLEKMPAPIVIFTFYALQQIPTVAPFLSALEHARSRIQAVIHLEPVWESFGDDLLGLLRRRYVQANDYNRDLLEQLRARPEIEIRELKPNLFGNNPVGPFSLVSWSFR